MTLGVVGIAVGLMGAVLLGLLGDAGALVGLLAAWAFWMGLGIGGLPLLFVNGLIGGRWSRMLEPVLFALTATIPALALAFVPVLLHLDVVYPWADPTLAPSHLWVHRAAWLNAPFFVARFALYTGVWMGLAFLLYRRRRHHRPAGPISAAGLMLTIPTMGFAAIDWTLSITELSSTMFAFLVPGAWTLGAFAAGVLVVVGLGRHQRLNTERLDDLGKLLLVFVLFWAYCQYFQYLIIWAGDTAEAIPWYLVRGEGTWLVLVIVMLGLGLAVPLLALLPRALRQDARSLGVIATLVASSQVLFFAWIVLPTSPGADAWMFGSAVVLLGLVSAGSARVAFDRIQTGLVEGDAPLPPEAFAEAA